MHFNKDTVYFFVLHDSDSPLLKKNTRENGGKTDIIKKGQYRQ